MRISAQVDSSMCRLIVLAPMRNRVRRHRKVRYFQSDSDPSGRCRRTLHSHPGSCVSKTPNDPQGRLPFFAFFAVALEPFSEQQSLLLAFAVPQAAAALVAPRSVADALVPAVVVCWLAVAAVSRLFGAAQVMPAPSPPLHYSQRQRLALLQ